MEVSLLDKKYKVLFTKHTCSRYINKMYLPLLVSIKDRNELYNRLRASHVYLAENLNLTQLLDHLLSEEVITMLDVDKVRAEKGFYKQNCCLLYILQTKSPSQIEKFIDSLVTTNQIHLAKLINPNGKHLYCNKHYILIPLN